MDLRPPGIQPTQFSLGYTLGRFEERISDLEAKWERVERYAQRGLIVFLVWASGIVLSAYPDSTLGALLDAIKQVLI